LSNPCSVTPWFLIFGTEEKLTDVPTRTEMRVRRRYTYHAHASGAASAAELYPTMLSG